MYFATWCIDRPGASEVRQANRPPHQEWLRKYKGIVKMGGPLLAPDGATSIGSLIVIEAQDEAAARAIYAEEPYAKAGVFQTIAIFPYRWVVDEPKKAERENAT